MTNGLCSWRPTSGSTHFCLSILFMKSMSGNSKLQAWFPCLANHVNQRYLHACYLCTSLCKQEQRNSYGKRRRTKPAVDNRFTPGLSAVHPQFNSQTRSVLHSWMQTSTPSPFFLCPTFSSQGWPGKGTKWIT